MPMDAVQMTVLGLMSGTSGDGVDAILLKFSDLHRPHLPQILGHAHVPFTAEVQAELQHPDRLSTRRLAELHQSVLPAAYAAAVHAIEGWQTAELCGMHGQTVWHQPPPHPVPCTYQIGNAAVLAQAIGMPVVADLRTADMLLGGQGAPIAPVAHWFFGSAQHPDAEPQLVVVNLGGICNLTWVAAQMEAVVAYDVGPGMCISDAFARQSSQRRLSCDLDGQLSRGGRLVPKLLHSILAHPFLHRAPPKSTGKEEFGADFYAPLLAEHAGTHAAADVAYTLLAATVGALAHAVGQDPRIAPHARRILLTGGGAYNPTLKQLARDAFNHCQIEVATEGVLAPTFHEPAAMALIAARTRMGLASSLPGVTGARRAAILGQTFWPEGPAGPKKARVAAQVP